MRIRDIINTTESVPYVTVSGDCSTEDVARLVAKNRHIRGIYVVDAQERLQGYLSLGVLIRNVIISRDRPHFHVRSLLTLISSHKVEDVMERYVVSATIEDDVATILNKMVHRNIKQVPVIDENRRIIANLGILDLWSALETDK